MQASAKDDDKEFVYDYCSDRGVVVVQNSCGMNVEVVQRFGRMHAAVWSRTIPNMRFT